MLSQERSEQSATVAEDDVQKWDRISISQSLISKYIQPRLMTIGIIGIIRWGGLLRQLRGYVSLHQLIPSRGLRSTCSMSVVANAPFLCSYLGFVVYANSDRVIDDHLLERLHMMKINNENHDMICVCCAWEIVEFFRFIARLCNW